MKAAAAHKITLDLVHGSNPAGNREDREITYGSVHGSNRRRGEKIGRSLMDLSMAATGGERRDREITLDQNHLWTQRGGPTQRREEGEEGS